MRVCIPRTFLSGKPHANFCPFDSSRQGSVTEVTTNAMLNPALIRMYAANTGTRPEVVTALIQGCSFGFCSNSTDRVRLAPGEKRLLLLSVRIDVTGGPAADVWCNGEGPRLPGGSAI